MKNEKVVDKIKEMLPSRAEIQDIMYEGANIVLYTKNEDFFLNGTPTIKEIVDEVKKRIKLRMSPNFLVDLEDAREIIEDMVPEEAGLKNLWFDSKRSLILIEAEKPGVVIGKDGERMDEIKEKTYWIPKVRRAPVVKSSVVDTIRKTLYQNSEYRRDFMNEIGKKIYHSEWEKDDNYWIRASCLGGFRQVGRSCILIQTPISNVLLDCGIDIASTQDKFPKFDIPELDIDKIDAVIITHAHLDHSGAIPLLFKYGYDGPVYVTEPTRDIMTLLQLDYISVAQGSEGGSEYTSREVKDVVKNTISLDYNEVTDICPDVRLTFHNAGHVLGSSLAHLNIGEGYHNLLYTGDFKYNNTQLLSKARDSFQRLETVIMESTYGGSDNMQTNRKKSEDKLVSIAEETIERDGKCLIPVLGVGRAQEVCLILEEAMRNGELSEVPIYIDGMIWDVTGIHTTYPEFMSEKVKNKVFGKERNPFAADYFKKVGSGEERRDIIDSGDSCIILATSGMLVGGSSIEYLAGLAENKDNSLVFVSYQAEGSLGRRIKNGKKEIPIETSKGKQHTKIRLDVNTIDGLSGHSDRKELMSFVKNLNPKPRKFILCHGESSKCLNLASSIHKSLHVETTPPRNMDAVRIK